MNPEDFYAEAISSTNDMPMPMDDDAPPIYANDILESESWKDRLQMKGRQPAPVMLNAAIALRFAPEWKGVIAFDDFAQKVRVVKEPPIQGEWPRDWCDVDDTNTTIWLQQQGIYVGRDTVSNVVVAISMENRVHAIRDYLNTVKWDGKNRISLWLTEYFGVEDSDYTSSVGRMWLVSAVARVMKPGCKADYMLVLEGNQGIKKSTSLSALCGKEFFCDHSPEIHNKDAQLQLSGSWIIEWAELDMLSRSEITAVKSFISREVEKYRLPYARHTMTVPRQCVFAGTTNEMDWMKDPTGNRRFWPVWCTRGDFDRIARDRDQIWAEAKHAYDNQVPWWPDDADTAAAVHTAQEGRLELDPWHEKIAEYVARLDRVSSYSILTDALKLEASRHGRPEALRVSRVLRALGFNKKKIRVNGSPVNGYERAEPIQGTF